MVVSKGIRGDCEDHGFSISYDMISDPVTANVFLKPIFQS